MVIQTRRGWSLENLCGLLRLSTIIHLRRMELVIEEPWGSLPLLNLALGCAAVPLKLLFSVGNVRQRDLLSGLRHPDEELFRSWWFRRVAVALHEPHQKFRVAINSRAALTTAIA